MHYITVAEEMKKIEQFVIEEVGVPSLVLMERASLSVSQRIKERALCKEKICVVCGCGNNGADGVAVARHLLEDKYKVDVVVLGNKEKYSQELKLQLNVFEKLGGKIFSEISDREYDYYVDAIFGIGLTREITDREILKAIETINLSDAYIYSVDIPSGIHTDTGFIMGSAVKANETITFTCDKVGLCVYPGKEYAGKVILQNIGIFEEFIRTQSPKHYGIGIGDLKTVLKDYPDGNKGTYGKVLVIAGNQEITGAALLCAKAAMKCGAGMVKVLSNEKTLDVIRTALPEAMVASLDHEDADYETVKKAILWADSVVCGPGIGTDKDAYTKLKVVLEEFPENKKLILDADALNILSMHSDLKQLASKVKEVVYTPHMKELSLLMNEHISKLKKDLDDCMKVVSEDAGIYVCKDSVTRVYAKDKPVYINRAGNCGMATAGCGDVLAGMIASMVARKDMNVYDGVVCAVYLHSYGADLAATQIGKNGLVAGDIIEYVTSILRTTEDGS